MTMKLLMTTATSVLGNHEASFWSDGKLEICSISEDADQVCGHVVLDELEQYRLLQELLVKFQAKGIRP